MAKITPKGKKVTGTKKKDKITWVSKKPWKKALTVKAGAGNDVINFKKSKYNNTIYGEAGKDTIYGGTKNDKIYGGKGNDKINAGNGKNTLYFSKGDGTDTILNGKGTDTLVFKTEKNIKNIKVAYSGNDAIITYTKGKVILKDYKKGGHSAKYLQVGSTKKAIADYFKPAPVPTPTSTPSPFEDGYYVVNGTSSNDSLIGKDEYDCKITGGAGNDTITGGKGNDKIYGGAGNDVINAGIGNNTIYVGKNEGTDTIENGGGTDTLVFSDAAGLRDLSFVYDGYDLTISAANANAVLINQMIFGSSVKYIKVGNEIIELPTGVTISSDNRFQINTSTRNEFVFGTYEGDDIQYIYTGSGNDTIFTTQNSSSTISAGVGDDLIIGSDGNGQYAYWLDAGNDTIYVGKGGAIDINPSLGNDVIYTAPTSENTGETNYLFDYIFGHDTIYWRGNTENKMSFDETEYDDIKLLKNPNNDDLIIACSTQNSVTLKDYFKAGNEGMATSFKLKGVDEHLFKEVGAVLAEKGLTDYARGTDGNDIINMEQDGYWVDGLTGDDKINAYKLFDTAYGGISNTISGGEGNDVITAGVGNDIIDGGEGNDTIAGIRGANTLMGGAGNDEINGGTGADTIYGGAGNDSISTGSGEVNDYVDGGDGNDTIKASQGGNNTLLGGEGNDSISGSNGSETIDGGDGDDYIDGAGGNDSINGGWGNDTIYGNGIIKGGRGNDKLCGGNGDDFLYAEYGDNTLRGGIGNNKFYSGTGSDTFEFANYSGRNTIYGATSSDKIVFSENYYKHEINKDGNDLIINYWDDERYPANYTKIRLDGYFSADDKLDTITYTDDDNNEHIIKISEQIINVTGSETIIGTVLNDSIIGSDVADNIVGDAGNDIITGGLGNDTINGGTGTNTICYSLGDGDDTIEYGGGVDTLVFEEGTNILTAQNGNNLVITYSGTVEDTLVSNTITVTNYYTTENHSVQYIKIGDNTYSVSNFYNLSRGDDAFNLTVSATSSAILTLTNPFAGSNYQYIISGDSSQSESFDVQYLANGRLAINGDHLVITAKSGQADDIILKGDYNYLETGDGNDIVRLGTVIDGDNNTVVQSDYNTINTGSGNDHIAYFGGNNTINMGTDTDSVMTFAANAPNNSVNGAEFNRYYAANEPYSSIDGTITTFNQGNAGDCRVLTIIENLSQKGMFSNAVSITVNDNDTYTVTFNNYNPADELYVNSTIVAKSDIEGFDNLHGDLDVVLTDYALNNLLGINELKDTINGDYTYIEIATYNTLANYFYGNSDMAAAFYDPSLTGYSYDYQTRVEAFWDLYQNNTINNLTVAFTCENDFDLGIISGHAYTLKNLDTENGYISLINPWDNQDVLNLDLDKFYSSNANIFVYGYKYNDEELVINNIETGSSYTDTYMALKGEVAGWTAANTEFTGTADVIQSGTDAQKSELIAYFINA